MANYTSAKSLGVLVSDPLRCMGANCCSLSLSLSLCDGYCKVVVCMKTNGCGSKLKQVLLHVSTYQGSILIPVFEPQPNGKKQDNLQQPDYGFAFGQREAWRSMRETFLLEVRECASLFKKPSSNHTFLPYSTSQQERSPGPQRTLSEALAWPLLAYWPANQSLPAGEPT